MTPTIANGVSAPSLLLDNGQNPTYNSRIGALGPTSYVDYGGSVSLDIAHEGQALG